jgi:carboxypeptidase Q
MRRWLVGIGLAFTLVLLLGAVEPEKVDLGVLHRIKMEAFGQNSRVMDTVFYLTDVYGPRLTGSPNIKDAGNWTVKKMQEWGLAGAKMEAWGPFGRGWKATRFSAMMKEPEFQPIIGFQQPWSPALRGP